MQKNYDPELWVCGGGPGVPVKYGYGYWAGPDGDLLCVIESANDVTNAERALSPISRFKQLAFFRFVLKRWWFLLVDEAKEL